MHLKRIDWLANYSKHVGFSDHSLVSRDGIIAAKAAIYCGADVVERHFTICDSSASKDGPVSITTHDIRDLIDFSLLSKDDQLDHLSELNKSWQVMLGESNRWLSDAELLNRDYYRGRLLR